MRKRIHPCSNENCNNLVSRKDVNLCKICYDLLKRKNSRISKEEKRLRIKKYKKEYFQKNKDKIYARIKLNPPTKEKREHKNKKTI